MRKRRSIQGNIFCFKRKAKSLLITGCALLNYLVQTSSAAVISWDGGGGDNQWSTAANWSGDVLPTATDDVVLDNIVVATSFTVTLPAGAISITIRTLTITPANGQAITLILPATNTANPGLSISGPGDALILNNSAVFRNSSGATAGSGILVSNTIRINNGGKYIHNTTRGNAGIVSQLSSAAGTELGIFEFDVPATSYVLSLSGRTYGSLRFSSAANGGSVSYSGSGASNTNVRGNLEINTGVSFSTSMSAGFIIHGNLDQSASSSFNLQSSSNANLVQVKGEFTSAGIITETGSGSPVLELNGSSQQPIDAGMVTFLNNVDLRLNNSAGATLLSSLTLPYRLSILSGNLVLGDHTLTTALINQISPATMTTNHIITNGTGTLTIRSIGASPVLFPIGPSSSGYNPVTITSAGSAADFSARVEEGINPAIAFPTFGINRTWFIHASTVTAGVHVLFQFATADANAGAVPPQDMEILMNTGGPWNIITGNTNIPTQGADPSWTVSTSASLTINTTSAAYALGADGGWILAPGCLINCKAQVMSTDLLVSWETNGCPVPRFFEVQRSVDGNNFQVIKIIPAGTGNRYSYLVSSVLPVKISYRIRAVFADSSFGYSNIISIKDDLNGWITRLYPNPLHHKGTLFIHAPYNCIAQINMIDVRGNLFRSWRQELRTGNSVIPISTDGFPAGNYMIIVHTAERQFTIPFQTW